MQIIVLVRVIVVLLTFITIHACTSPEPKTEIPEFDYFPQTNVYYDKANNTFIYSIDSGRTWETYVPITGKEPGTMGRKVAIQSAKAEVWENNEEHRSLYNGNLLNLEAERILAATTGVAERKVSKARTVKPKQAQPKEKKGVKGFLEKLFKKKKE